MATRFAGDFFGVSLVDPGEEEGSSLLRYYPELRSISKKKQAAPETEEDGTEETTAKLYGGATAAPVFGGFKTFERSSETKAAPLFTGFKTFEQPR